MDDRKLIIFYETYDQELMAGVYGEVLWQGHGDHFSEGFSPFAFICLNFCDHWPISDGRREWGDGSARLIWWPFFRFSPFSFCAVGGWDGLYHPNPHSDWTMSARKNGWNQIQVVKMDNKWMEMEENQWKLIIVFNPLRKTLTSFGCYWWQLWLGRPLVGHYHRDLSL